MDDEHEPPYDFSDWNPGKVPELDEYVRDNLRGAFAQFADGRWAVDPTTAGGNVFTWVPNEGSWEYRPAFITITPDDVVRVLLHHIECDGLSEARDDIDRWCNAMQALREQVDKMPPD